MRGFTLIEILITIALMAILFVIITPIQFLTLTTTRIDRDIATGVDMARRAHVLARADDEPWSVFFDTDAITLFKGDDFESRDTDFDEKYTLSVTHIPDTQEVVFQANSGLPQSQVSVVLTDNETLEYPIAINKYGIIFY